MVSENFLVEDIKFKINHNLFSEQYMRGFLFACYQLEAIKEDTHTGLKKYLRESLGGKVNG